MKKWKVGRGKKIKTKYACIKFNTFVPMATIQHVIHLSSRIRADGVHCLGPGEHGCLEQRPPPLPPSERHPGHSPCCYFSLIHIGLVFSLLITRQMTKKKREGDNAVQYWGMAFMILMNTIRRGGAEVGIREKFRGPNLRPTPQRFSLPAFRFGGRWRQRRAQRSMTGCQDQFNSHNRRKRPFDFCNLF